MSGIFTLLNDDTSKPNIDIIRELCKKDNTVQYTIENVMIKALFGITNNKEIVMINDIAVICDGRIYNYEKIYKDLSITPKTTYDYEVIIYLYEKYGIEYTLQMLDGIFAFILIDNRIKDENSLDAKMYVARDPYGVKPLYISRSGNLFAIFNKKGMFSSRGMPDDGTSVGRPIFAEERNPDANDNTEDILPGTYSSFHLTYKVLSYWEIEKFQIPYYTYSSGYTISYDQYNLDNYRKITILENILNNSIHKRFFHNQNSNNIYIYLHTGDEPIHKWYEWGNSIFDKVFLKNKNTSKQIISKISLCDIIERNDSNKNRMKYYTVWDNDITKKMADFNPHSVQSAKSIEQEGDIPTIVGINWQVIAIEISKQFPGSVVFIDDFIKKEISQLFQSKGIINSRYIYQSYLKHIYKNLDTISDIFYNAGLEIDSIMLDIEFIEHYLLVETAT
jgi:Glutamine amidotransferase domain